jgi:hypothetical protein
VRLARLAATCAAAATLCALALAPTSGLASTARRAAVHYACSGPNAAHMPCWFSTPSGDIRCLWTPHPNMVACELRSTRHAFLLRPTGHAKATRLNIRRSGETLPTSQEIVFPQALSCRDTRTTITCNQDYGEGEFTLGPHRSHAALAPRRPR